LAAIFLAALLLSGLDRPAVAAAPPAAVFVAGEGGYHTYRIPALVVSARGTVLAFCEGRKTSGRDDGDIDLLLRRSRDGGATWEPLQLVQEEGGAEPITIGNPCPIVANDGTIHLLFTRNNQRAFYTRSTDDGATFSAPREISDALKSFDFPWRRLGPGPGHGLQIESGRLLAPIWLNDRIGQDYRSGVIFSDDGGSTWKTGGLVAPDIRGCNECAVAELGDGRLRLNMRNRQAKCRVEALSTDGGVTWSRPRLVEALIDPQCQGSLLSLRREGRALLVFANAAAVTRKRLTVRLSHDRGQTWSGGQVLHAGPSAYSDLAATPAGTVLCLYECGEKSAYQQIALARLDLE
jgi:sialidase-1